MTNTQHGIVLLFYKDFFNVIMYNFSKKIFNGTKLGVWMAKICILLVALKKIVEKVCGKTHI